MKKYLLAIAIASGTLYGLSAQAAPALNGSGVQSQVGSSVEKVWHCRRWSGGWGCGGGGGWHNRWRSHWRWGSHRRWWR
ncbi:MAG: hypothetical protein WBX25_27110 [Rhodomicrobium sp.]